MSNPAHPTIPDHLCPVCSLWTYVPRPPRYR